MGRTETLRGKRNEVLGFVEEGAGGKQTLKGPRHEILGYYDANRDVTMNTRHQVVGKGNVLLTLLSEAS